MFIKNTLYKLKKFTKKIIYKYFLFGLSVFFNNTNTYIKLFIIYIKKKINNNYCSALKPNTVCTLKFLKHKIRLVVLFYIKKINKSLIYLYFKSIKSDIYKHTIHDFNHTILKYLIYTCVLFMLFVKKKTILICSKFVKIYFLYTKLALIFFKNISLKIIKLKKSVVLGLIIKTVTCIFDYYILMVYAHNKIIEFFIEYIKYKNVKFTKTTVFDFIKNKVLRFFTSIKSYIIIIEYYNKNFKNDIYFRVLKNNKFIKFLYLKTKPQQLLFKFFYNKCKYSAVSNIFIIYVYNTTVYFLKKNTQYNLVITTCLLLYKFFKKICLIYCYVKKFIKNTVVVIKNILFIIHTLFIKVYKMYLNTKEFINNIIYIFNNTVFKIRECITSLSKKYYYIKKFIKIIIKINTVSFIKNKIKLLYFKFINTICIFYIIQKHYFINLINNATQPVFDIKDALNKKKKNIQIYIVYVLEFLFYILNNKHALLFYLSNSFYKIIKLYYAYLKFFTVKNIINLFCNISEYTMILIIYIIKIVIKIIKTFVLYSFLICKISILTPIQITIISTRVYTYAIFYFFITSKNIAETALGITKFTIIIYAHAIFYFLKKIIFPVLQILIPHIIKCYYTTKVVIYYVYYIVVKPQFIIFYLYLKKKKILLLYALKFYKNTIYANAELLKAELCYWIGNTAPGLLLFRYLVRKKRNTIRNINKFKGGINYVYNKVKGFIKNIYYKIIKIKKTPTYIFIDSLISEADKIIWAIFVNTKKLIYQLVCLFIKFIKYLYYNKPYYTIELLLWLVVLIFIETYYRFWWVVVLIACIIQYYTLAFTAKLQLLHLYVFFYTKSIIIYTITKIKYIKFILYSYLAHVLLIISHHIINILIELIFIIKIKNLYIPIAYLYLQLIIYLFTVGLVVFYIIISISVILISGVYPYLERKKLSLIQRRNGPSVVGLNGRLQFIVDSVKVFFKKYIIIFFTKKSLFLASPIFFLYFNSMFAFLFSYYFNTYVYDIEYSIIILLVLSSISAILNFSSSFISKNKYTIIAASRGVLVFFMNEFLISLFTSQFLIITESFSITDVFFINKNNFGIQYYIVTIPIIIFMILSEINKTPFDYQEAESELVMGSTTEYSSFLFAVFILAEYIHIYIYSYLFIKIMI